MSQGEGILEAGGAGDAAGAVDAAPANESSGNTSPGGGNDASGGLGETLLTAPDAKDSEPGEPGESGEKGQKTDTGKEADPEALVPAKAEEYQITFVDDVTVDKGLLQDFKARAHELGISQGQAQKLADFYVKHAASNARAMQDAQINALREAEKGWVAEIESRPGYARELADARRMIKEFGSEEMTELINQSRLGSHPVFFDFVVKVGKALAEPDSRGTGQGGKEQPLIDRLWPGMK